jgi:XRE family transcriptional regulator, fatty acid utilization regulator
MILTRQELRFARRVKALRMFRGYTQEHVATALDIPRSAMSEIETGRRAVRLGEVHRLAEILGAPLPDLLGDSPLVLSTPIAE